MRVYLREPCCARRTRLVDRRACISAEDLDQAVKALSLGHLYVAPEPALLSELIQACAAADKGQHVAKLEAMAKALNVVVPAVGTNSS